MQFDGLPSCWWHGNRNGSHLRACVSGVSAVLLASLAIEVAAYHALYEQRVNDHLSGGKSVLVAGSIQSPSEVLRSCRRSNYCPRVPQPSKSSRNERGGMERRLIRRSPWGSVVSQQPSRKDDQDQDEHECNQERHPPPRLWITCDHGLVIREGATRKPRPPRLVGKLSFVESMRRLVSGLARKEIPDDEESGHRPQYAPRCL